MQPSRRRTTGLVLAAVAAFAASLLTNPVAPASAATSVTATATATAPASAQHRQLVRGLRKMIVLKAKSAIGARYVWGGSGPDEFDCSGLVMWVYREVIGRALPHYSGAQMDVTTPLSPDRKLRRGDLLFYGPDGSQHVAIYVGRGKQIGANNPRTGIVVDAVDSSYWSARYVGAGRIIS